IQLNSLRNQLQQIRATKLSERIVTLEQQLESTNALLASREAEKEKDVIIQALQTPNEIACAHIIHQQLIPLTINYRIHLLAEAHKINPEINVAEHKGPLPNLSDKPLQAIHYAKISAKYDLLDAMLNALSDSTTVPLPSARVHTFAQSLNKAQDALKKPRDEPWIAYCKNCFIAISIVCTGIIPGIAFILGYALYTKKSPLFFTQSEGEQYVQTAAQVSKT
ncbi:MAG: hypothetical protein ACHP6H_06835, partial [Legionellales bacterium]